CSPSGQRQNSRRASRWAAGHTDPRGLVADDGEPGSEEPAQADRQGQPEHTTPCNDLSRRCRKMESRITVRMTDTMIAQIDAWIACQSGYVSRQETVRRLVALS